MGYYTDYRVVNIQGDSAARMKRDFYDGLIETSIGNLGELFEDLPGYSAEPYKWDNCTEDMSHISRRYPDTLIILQGQGEDSDDLWRGYFRNGNWETVFAEISWRDPSEELLTGCLEKEDLPDQDY